MKNIHLILGRDSDGESASILASVQGNFFYFKQTNFGEPLQIEEITRTTRIQVVPQSPFDKGGKCSVTFLEITSKEIIAIEAGVLAFDGGQKSRIAIGKRKIWTAPYSVTNKKVSVVGPSYEPLITGLEKVILKNEKVLKPQKTIQGKFLLERDQKFNKVPKGYGALFVRDFNIFKGLGWATDRKGVKYLLELDQFENILDGCEVQPGSIVYYSTDNDLSVQSNYSKRAVGIHLQKPSANGNSRVVYSTKKNKVTKSTQFATLLKEAGLVKEKK